MRFALACCLLASCATGGEVDTGRGDGGMPRRRDTGPGGGDPDAGPAGDPCAAGEVGVCSTTCGTMGTRNCEGGFFGPCLPPPEDCNDRDDDCDGMNDDGIAPRMCAMGCGTGSETCTAGTWSGCTAVMPRPETCDNTDEDCDSRVDEGLSRGCTGMCGTGTETCSGGAWVGCTAPRPMPETCDGRDEDCDGTADEGLTRGCTSACGMGMESCAGGTWVGCTAPAPRTEICNRTDDDCDGMSDEDFTTQILDPVAMTELRAQQPACDGPGARMDFCLTAAHRWCVSRAERCQDSGAGFLQATATGARVACFGAGTATVVMSTFADVTAASGIAVDDSNIGNRIAQSASNRFCRSRGHECGIGPVEHSNPVIYVTCLSAAACAYTDLATSDLRARGCDPIADPHTLQCQAASDVICRTLGHDGGYGPVEWNDAMSAILCFR